MALATYLTIGAFLVVPAVSHAIPLWQEASAGARVEKASSLPELSPIATKAMSAVVSISTVQAAESSQETAQSFLDPEDESQKGLGSGFFVHPAGYLVTNAHVIEDVTGVRVSLRIDGVTREYPARVVGADPPTDVALLKVEADREDFPILPLGDSDALGVADWVVAIGNPYGLSHSVTVGVVSYKGRTDVMPAGRDGYYDYLQIDASINPGNSGGPILNTRGEVVGIANAVNAVGQGIGFAIPINMAKQVLMPLLTEGKVARSWLGISVEDLSPQMLRGLGLPPTLAGVMVSEIVRGAPGEQAGLKVGDVITSFDGVRVNDAQRLRWLAAVGGAGREAQVSLNRQGHAVHLMVSLAPMPNDEPQVSWAQPDDVGLVVRRVDVPTARTAGLALPIGAQVSSVKQGSAAEGAGLKKGDVLLKVDEHTIYAPDALSQALAKVRRGETVRLVVRRGAETLFIAMRRP